MSLEKKLRYRSQRRARRVRHRFKTERPRVSVFRSLRHIYAQVISDSQSKTLAHASTHDLESSVSGDKTQKAHLVGLELAKRARAQGVTLVAFDRGSCKFHGRVKALADGLREGGLEF